MNDNLDPTWIIHYVTGDLGTPTGVNIHTHGLQEQFGHLELQMIIPLSEEQTLGIVNDLGARIRAGERFEPNQIVNGILIDMPITFAMVMSNGHEVLRVILPDKDGNVDRATMAYPYMHQYDNCLEPSNAHRVH